MSLPFEEWSREEKDEYARKKMEEMKVRNEQLKKRYEEVEKDRKAAEGKKASVTSLLNTAKEVAGKTPEIVSKPQVIQREWDKGKSLLNLEHWNNRKPDNHYDNYEQMYWGANRGERKNSRTATSFRNETSFRGSRGRGYRRGTYNHSNMQDSRKQQFNFSQDRSDLDMNQFKRSGKYENNFMRGSMRRGRAMHDVPFLPHYRQVRVARWVKSVNDECFQSDFSKTDRAGYQNKPWNREEEYLVTELKMSDSDKIPKSNWKAKYNSKKQIPESYSATYENKDFKKQGERNANSWRKPNIPGKAEFIANLSKVEDDPPEFEISEDMIVKIEGHTLKRIYSNNEAVEENLYKPVNVAKDEGSSANEDCIVYSDYYKLSEDATEEYNKLESVSKDEWGSSNEDCVVYSDYYKLSEDEPFPENEDNQQGNNSESDQWEKSGRWGDCKYDEDVPVDHNSSE
ncbi:hypothetical protein JTE90_005264 [Oedothorax gibbosus]|uniref:Uncharacterized protein n=1 Tax=Oedothorax gibbosus TaxID=931172 RepID=A0AAV6U5V2_9ARAC|nr:hypothetical protein JTE90_005264 [Oedothorax gibbosus]